MSRFSLIGTGVIAAVVLVAGLSSCSTVDSGEIGLFNRYGQISNEVATPGLHFTMPFVTKIERMTIQSQRKNGETPIYTSDMQTAQVKFAVTYALEPGSAVAMRKSVGHEWEQRLIPPVVESSIKTVFGRSTAINAIANRGAMQDSIQTTIRQTLAQRGIRVESFQLTNIDYSDAFENAVESAQVATQNAVAARNQTVTIRERAAQTVLTAQADAESMRVKAAAIAANPALTQYEAVKRWNGQLPQNMYGGAPVPFINIK